MDSIPIEFKRFVKNIESSQSYPVHLEFLTLEELTCSATYFFERAVLHQDLSDKFAQAVAKLYFITPLGLTEPNLRKVLILETQVQLERLHEKINSASNLELENALGVVKFFGELYNVGFIFKGVVKKNVDFFLQNKNSCFISNRCFQLLLSTVEKKVLSSSEEDYSTVIRSLVEIIEDARNHPTNPPIIKDTKIS